MKEPAIEYLPARYVPGKRSLVAYSVWHPELCRMVRYRTYFDRVRDVRSRLDQAQRFCDKINVKLANGWRPWHDDGPSLASKPVAEMLRAFLESKTRTLRPRSLPNYVSRIKRFSEWLKGRGWARITCAQITPQVAVMYFDHLTNEGTGARTLNNYLIDMRALGNWAIKRGYMAQNPWQAVERAKAGGTNKRALTDIEVKRMMGRIRDTDPGFFLVCALVYYAALRPEEITRIRCGQIDVARGMIWLKAEHTKDNTAAWVTLPRQVLRPLAEHISGADANDHLISTGMEPGPHKIYATRLAERWAKHRAALNLPPEVRLYGLKDTALMRLLASGASPATVRDHARHSSLEVTDAYIKTLRGFADGVIRDQFPDM